ncbi:MAG: hypothetical protein JXA37_05155 [Chloroflexia bacterium]|nr:hypothetical protein [Chloroflexia bacterium]
MRPVEQLWQLQQIDDEIAAREERLKEWAAHRQKRAQSLSQARESFAHRRQELQQQQVQLRQLELDLQDMESRLQKMQQRLYSNAIRSPKEASALQAEIEQLRQQKSAVEDQILELLLEVDEQKVALQGLEREEGQALEELEAGRQQAAHQEAQISEQIEQLQHRRTEQVESIPSPALDRYEQLRRTLGQAVARVQGSTCEGCHLEVALLTRKAALLGDELVRCETCGRILYVTSL